MAAQPHETHENNAGISKISVTGFKSLANKTDLEIRPLTVLAGANSSGKSSFMQPMLLMKQTLEKDVNPAGPFLLSGSYTRYTEAKQFLSRPTETADPRRSLTFEFRFDEGLTAGMRYSAGTETGLGVEETWGSNFIRKSQWRISAKSSPDDLRALLLESGSIPLLMDQVGLTLVSVSNCEFYQCILFSVPTGQGSRGFGIDRRELYYMQENLTLNSHIRRMLYVPGLRGDQHRKWLFTDISERGFFEGPFESYVPSLIYSWQLPGNRSKITQLVKALSTLDVATGISQERLSESELEILVPRTSNSDVVDFVNVADVGLAVSTVLPVVVALIQAEPGQLVYIEQPELHLHPRAQLKLAQLIADAANRGARLVIETHSSLLLRGILTEVAQSNIPSSRVILHWFEQNKESGISTVHSKEPDSAGRVGDWPEDFGDVELASTNEYLDAAEHKLFAEKK
jgi:hypothetical protein